MEETFIIKNIAHQGIDCAFSPRRWSSRASLCFGPYEHSEFPKQAAGSGNCTQPNRSGASIFWSDPALYQPMSCIC